MTVTQTTSVKGSRITGDAREQLIRKIKDLYVHQRQPIRAIADSIGRSYGFVHRVLSDADDVELRRRGGGRHTAADR